MIPHCGCSRVVLISRSATHARPCTRWGSSIQRMITDREFEIQAQAVDTISPLETGVRPNPLL
eukprot:3073908-Pyramimonas_sp.AAC.1